MPLEHTPLHESYARLLLSYDWSHYLTVTFRSTRHDGTNAVSAVWEKLWNRFEAEIGFFAVEPHRLDGIHLHALVGYYFHEPLRSSIQHYCTKAFGWSKCESAKNMASVSLYCTKYVVKQNDFYFKGYPETWDRLHFREG